MMNQTMNQTKPTNRTIKSLAGQMFKGYFFEALIILIIVELIALVPGKIINFFFSNSVLLSYLADVYTLLIRGPLSFGAAIYFLCNFRNQRVRYNCLMYGFDYFAKSAAIFIFTFILTMTGFILFIIPGFIAMINFSQAMFILVDNPNKQALQCMAESKNMMRGHKMDMVSFALSYWLPFILTRAPEVILTWCITEPVTFEQFQANPMLLTEMQNQVYASPWYILCQFAMLLFTVYFYMGRSAFYDILAGNLVFRDGLSEDSPSAQDAQSAPGSADYIFTEIPRTESTMDDASSENVRTEDQTSDYGDEADQEMTSEDTADQTLNAEDAADSDSSGNVQ